MSLPLSLRASVVLLAVLCVVAAQAVSFAVLVAFPTAPPPALTPAAVAAVVLDPQTAAAAGLRVRQTATAPFQPDRRAYTRIVARTLLSLLSKADAREVRVQSLSDAVSIHSEGAPPPTSTLRAFLRPGAAMDLAHAPFPSFATGVLRADRRWTVLEPARPAIPPDHLRIIAAFGLSLLILTPVTWWCARRLTRPLQLLARASQNLQYNPGAPPLRVEGPREVQAASLAFNAMQAGLAAQTEARITLMAAIAHDLRTPLTSLRLRAETTPPEPRERMVADIARMERLVGDLMVYVRGGRPSPTSRSFDLAGLAAEVVSEAQARGWLVTLVDRTTAMAVADPVSIRRVLENLVENASIYAGSARVALGRDAAWVWVSVDDDGPGVSADAREAVFQPFVRLESSRSLATGGVGLGLAIARTTARAYGGDVELFPRSPQGLSARMRLPARSG